MSIFLGRILHNIENLDFSVCLNFTPTSINAECEDVDELGNYYDVPYDGNPIAYKSINLIFSGNNFNNELGLNWNGQEPTCLSISVPNPKHKLYKIRYMR